MSGKREQMEPDKAVKIIPKCYKRNEIGGEKK